MYLENNNIKVLRIYFKFSIEKLRKNLKKFIKIFRKVKQSFRKYRKFLENLANF